MSGQPPVAGAPLNPTIARCRRDPHWFAREILGVFLWSAQITICESVRDHDATTVRSCHGVGKTFIAAVVALWFLYCWPDSNVITTAPTGRQVEQLLWREIAHLHANARVPLGGHLTATGLELDPKWFAIGYKGADTKPETFAGFHAPHMLVIFDEASGIDERVFAATAGYRTAEHVRRLLIGNGTQLAGEFHASFHDKARLYVQHSVDMLTSPNFTRDRVAQYPRIAAIMERDGIPYSTEDVPDEVRAKLPQPFFANQMLDEHGEDSFEFEVKVRGRFPTHATDTVISLGSVEQAEGRGAAIGRGEPVSLPGGAGRLMVDVARFGDDSTVFAARLNGSLACVLDSYNGKDLMQTVGWTIKYLRQLREAGHLIEIVVIDDTGLGGGVTDRLRELKEEGHVELVRVKIIAFNGGDDPVDKEKYINARSEGWCTYAEALRRGAAIVKDTRLRADLTAPKYKYNSHGQRVVEPKAETKKRLARSPDFGDAVWLGWVPDRGGITLENRRDAVYGGGRAGYDDGIVKVEGRKHADK